MTVTIDGFEITVPKGMLVIRAAELLGIQIPRFCDHPLLDPVGACRQCLVEVEGQAKPLASCTTTCTDGMKVRTQLTSRVAEKAQSGVMELLLINHPLDCPMCDKGGECPLQNQAMSSGRGESRFTETKRTFAKPVALSSEVLLDRERCVSCARCTRFAEQIAGDPLIELLDRGPEQQVGTADGVPFDSYFSGNTVQICPVGALTGAAYRFRARPFDLVSTPSICEHCASGCRQRTDHRRGRVTRRLAGNDPQVNEEWNCDKGRWAFTYATQPDRLATPLVRDEEGVLRAASWAEAIGAAAAGLAGARGRAGVLTGGRLTLEDAYAYAKFARVALGSNDIDFRARPHSAEEAQFLAAVRRRAAASGSATPTWRRRPAVLLAGFEPEDESPMVFLRLRKAARKGGLAVYSVAPFASRGLAKLCGDAAATVPGAEARARPPARRAPLRAPRSAARRGRAGRRGRGAGRRGAVIMAGERLAEVPGCAVRGGRGWPRRPGRGWPGSRAARASAARSRPARCRTCSRSAGPSATRKPARRSRGPGAWPRCRPSRAGTRADPRRRRRRGTRRPGRRRGGPWRPARPGGRARRPGRDAVHRQPGAAGQRGHRPGGRGAAGGGGRGEGGHIRQLGGPRRHVRRGSSVPGVRSDLYVLGRIADEMDVHLGLPDAGPPAPRSARSAAGAGPGRPSRPSRPAPHGRGRAGRGVLATWHLLLDDRADAGRRAVPGGHSAAGRGADVGGDRGRGRGDRRERSPCPPHAGSVTAARRVPTCRTGWCGCPPTRPAARSGAASAPATAPG